MIEKIASLSERAKEELIIAGVFSFFILEGIGFFFLYLIGILRWGFEVGMFLIFMSLGGLFGIWLLHAFKKEPLWDERTKKIGSKALNHGFYSLIIIQLHIVLIDMYSEISLTSIFTVYLGFIGFAIVFFASAFIQRQFVG
ncbi:MAG: hypothetical protein ACFFC7_25370 [Candidatus Hermodarchaeota archaeon]